MTWCARFEHLKSMFSPIIGERRSNPFRCTVRKCIPPMIGKRGVS